MSIPTNLEKVGYNEATVNMDVDAMVRESMIRLFSLVDDAGNKLDPYDEKYNEYAETNTGLDYNNSGAATLVRQFVLLEGKIMGFVFQQFLYMTKPITTALELPQLLAKPPQLISKIKEIIEGIKKLIDDIVTFFTDTLQWFMDLLMSEIMSINIPVPSFDFSILGITIPIPAIDNLGKVGTEPYVENLTDSVMAAKDKLKSLRLQISNIKDAIDPASKEYKGGTMELVDEQVNKLLTVDVQKFGEFYDIAMKIQNNVILEKDKIVRKELKEKKVTGRYTFVDRTDELQDVKAYIDDNTETKKHIPLYNGKISTLIDAPSVIMSIIETEEKEIEQTINNHNMESSKSLNKQFKEIDRTLISYMDQLNEVWKQLRDISADVDAYADTKKEVSNSGPDLIIGGSIEAARQQIDKLEDEVKATISEIMKDSPATAWAEKLAGTMIGVIKSPIEAIISIITKIIEGIIEFLKQLPFPTFAKIKEFFSDLIGLANPDKMQEVVSKMITEISGAGEEFKPVIDNVVKFVPWLVTETAANFVASLAEPLPIRT